MQDEQSKLLIPVETTRSACAGAAAAYLMRRVAARAGSYAPGIQEHLFFQLARRPVGASLDSVMSWFHDQGRTLTSLGYYILTRRIAARTEQLAAWVQDGEGYRAAVLAVDGRALYAARRSEGDAVGLLFHDPTSGIADSAALQSKRVAMVDPWPDVDTFASPPDTLDGAHRQKKYGAVLLYWSGYA